MNNKTKVLIIDDDVKSVESLCEMLSDYPDFEIIGSAYSYGSAKTKIMELGPDFLFLDIELPDGNGLDLLKVAHETNEDMYVVVFTGYFKDYAGQAFDKNESDYLLKPVSELELNKVIRRFRHEKLVNNTHELKVPDAILSKKDVFTATTYTNDLRVMRLADIGYFRYSMHRKVWEVALNDHSFIQLKRGTSANDILRYSTQFVQIHQSYIVNLSYLLIVGVSKCRLFPPFDSEELPVGRTYSRNLRKMFQEI